MTAPRGLSRYFTPLGQLVDGVAWARRFAPIVGHDATTRADNDARLAALSAERDRLLERMQRQFDHMASACIVLSVDGKVLQINPAHQRVFGYTPQQVVGRPIGEFVHNPSFLDEIHRWFEQLRLDPDSTLTGVYENTAVDGRAITCRWTGTALRDMDGQFGGLIGMAEDITEQVLAEHALRKSEQRYRTLTEISPVGIFRTDITGQTVFVNSRYSDILGLTVDECLGLGSSRAIHADDAPGATRAWQAYLQSGGRANYAPEYRILRRNGSIVWVLAQISPELDFAGRVQGHIGTITDITALKAAQFELRLARDHLEERVAERTTELERAKEAVEHSDRVKSAFLSTMSHELRTPLNSILGFTDVLLLGLSGPLTETQRRQLQVVRESSTHLSSLIEDVLDISRIEAGQIGLVYGEIDLGELVSARVAAFRPEFERKGIDLCIDVQESLSPLWSDRRRAEQIVNNLLSNALKFTEQGGVTVALRTTDRDFELVVADTGIGIPLEAQAELFNPFSQVVRPGGRIHEGTGLGLAIARNLARALGGEITVHSAPGEGSRFMLSLPRVAPATDDTSASGTFRRTLIRRALGAV